jgi:hypothetical protein
MPDHTIQEQAEEAAEKAVPNRQKRGAITHDLLYHMAYRDGFIAGALSRDAAQAIAFAEWIHLHAFFSASGNWYVYGSLIGETYSTEDLYKIFTASPDAQNKNNA